MFKKEFEDSIDEIYSVLLPKLNTQDIDQEVKEEAINCSALLITNVGDKLGNGKGLEECFLIFQDRLSNEITRLTTVKALELIAKSPLKLDLSSILPSCIEQLTSFLRLVRIYENIFCFFESFF